MQIPQSGLVAVVQQAHSGTNDGRFFWEMMVGQKLLFSGHSIIVVSWLSLFWLTQRLKRRYHWRKITVWSHIPRSVSFCIWFSSKCKKKMVLENFNKTDTTSTARAGNPFLKPEQMWLVEDFWNWFSRRIHEGIAYTVIIFWRLNSVPWSSAKPS